MDTEPGSSSPGSNAAPETTHLIVIIIILSILLLACILAIVLYFLIRRWIRKRKMARALRLIQRNSESNIYVRTNHNSLQRCNTLPEIGRSVEAGIENGLEARSSTMPPTPTQRNNVFENVVFSQSGATIVNMNVKVGDDDPGANHQVSHDLQNEVPPNLNSENSEPAAIFDSPAYETVERNAAESGKLCFKDTVTFPDGTTINATPNDVNNSSPSYDLSQNSDDSSGNRPRSDEIAVLPNDARESQTYSICSSDTYDSAAMLQITEPSPPNPANKKSKSKTLPKIFKSKDLQMLKNPFRKSKTVNSGSSLTSFGLNCSTEALAVSTNISPDTTLVSNKSRELGNDDRLSQEYTYDSASQFSSNNIRDNKLTPIEHDPKKSHVSIDVNSLNRINVMSRSIKTGDNNVLIEECDNPISINSCDDDDDKDNDYDGYEFVNNKVHCVTDTEEDDTAHDDAYERVSDSELTDATDSIVKTNSAKFDIANNKAKSKINSSTTPDILLDRDIKISNRKEGNQPIFVEATSRPTKSIKDKPYLTNSKTNPVKFPPNTLNSDSSQGVQDQYDLVSNCRTIEPKNQLEIPGNHSSNVGHGENSDVMIDDQYERISDSEANDEDAYDFVDSDQSIVSNQSSHLPSHYEPFGKLLRSPADRHNSSILSLSTTKDWDLSIDSILEEDTDHGYECACTFAEHCDECRAAHNYEDLSDSDGNYSSIEKRSSKFIEHYYQKSIPELKTSFRLRQKPVIDKNEDSFLETDTVSDDGLYIPMSSTTSPYRNLNNSVRSVMSASKTESPPNYVLNMSTDNDDDTLSESVA